MSNNSNSSYNFKDALTIDNNKYLKWLDTTGTTRSNIISLDNNNDVNLNSAFGDIYLNNNGNSSYTFINTNQTCGVIIGSKIGVGFNTTSNMSSTVTLVNNGFIGLNTTRGTNNGYLGLVGGYALSNTVGSRILMYGNNATVGGQLNLYAGNNTYGNISFYTANDSLKCQILYDGTFNVMPDGITSRLNINDQYSTFTNKVNILNTTNSTNWNNGSFTITGGLGIGGDLYINGTINVNKINWSSTEISTSFSNGSISLLGGLGISCTENSSSITSGGGISIAGGMAIAKDTYIGGQVAIMNTSIPFSSFTGSIVVYGGMGINGPIFSRSNYSPQIKLAPMTTNLETSISFYSNNNYTSNSNSSWTLGHNINSIGPGNFNLTNSLYGSVFSCKYNGSSLYTGIGMESRIPNTIFQIGYGGRLYIANNNNDCTVIGTNDTNNNLNTSIVLYGNENNLPGNISYISTNVGSHTWYTTDENIAQMTLQSDGNIILMGELMMNNDTNAENVDYGGALTVLGGASFKKDVYIGGTINLGGGASISGNSGSGGGGSTFSYLTLTATDNSINLSTGALVTFGGITIQTTQDATSITNGGAFLVAGGASIQKNLFIGGPILQIPCGSTVNRPSPSAPGYIRYNTTTSQFEGYGPGNAWGSLGGVVDIAQTTKILASSNPSITDGNLYFYTVGTERMRINSSGNIGINTTSPEYLVDISGNTRITNGSLLATGNSNTVGSIFTTSGNVGISIVNPRSKLHVNGAGYFGNGIVSQSIGYEQIIITPNTNYLGTSSISMEVTSTKKSFLYTDSSIGTILGNNFSSISINSNNVNSVYIDGNNVGINTTSPNYNLDINGDFYVSNNSYINNNSYVSGNSYVIGNLNASDGTLGNLYTTNGNIGINISSPNYTLDVNGNTHISADLYVDGMISGSGSSSSTFAYLTLTATDDSINLSTGSLVTFGGITIQDPADSTSITCGGSFLTAGGASIMKNLYVGKNINTETIIINSTDNAIGINSGGSLTVLGGTSISQDLYVGGTVISSSDKNLKTNFKQLPDNLLDKIKDINPVKYNKIKEYNENDDSNVYIGFIAQEFEKDFPELIYRSSRESYYGLAYDRITALNFKCIKELIDINKKLQKRIGYLEEKFNNLNL